MSLNLIGERIYIREITKADAPFILQYVNTPEYIANIIDRNVRSIADAEKYIEADPIHHYQTFGFGTWLICLRENDVPIGTCGIKKRDFIFFPDIGYGLMPSFTGKGYAEEAARLVIDYAAEGLKLDALNAFMLPANKRSVSLAQKLGFKHQYHFLTNGDILALHKLALKRIEFSITLAEEKDLPQLTKLFADTIEHTCQKDYSPAQRKTWSKSANALEKWERKIKNQYFIKAIYKDTPIGFASLEGNCLDMMYVHKDFQGWGIAHGLLQHIELRAIQNDMVNIVADVSITALPFFEKNGFQIVKKNQIKKDDEILENFSMIKKNI